LFQETNKLYVTTYRAKREERREKREERREKREERDAVTVKPLVTLLTTSEASCLGMGT
jgi:hypothetical protein